MEIKNLLSLIEAVSESELTGFKYEEDGVKLHLSKKQDKVHFVTAEPASSGIIAPGITANMAASGVSVSDMAAGKTAHTAAQEETQSTVAKADGKTVVSPLVGTFYTAPSEDAEAFVSVGDTVKKGQTLAIVEAMKLMNEIESEYDGTIAEILVENGQAVEYGQPLFRIR